MGGGVKASVTKRNKGAGDLNKSKNISVTYFMNGPSGDYTVNVCNGLKKFLLTDMLCVEAVIFLLVVRSRVLCHALVCQRAFTARNVICSEKSATVGVHHSKE